MFNDLPKVTKLAQDEAHIKKPVFSDCRYLFYLPGLPAKDAPMLPEKGVVSPPWPVS